MPSDLRVIRSHLRGLGAELVIASANNASIGLLAAYTQWVPAFERLFDDSGRDFACFYAATREIAALPTAQRQARLAALTSEAELTPP